MEKEFAPYKLALAMKELGFDEKCFSFYWNDGEFHKGISAAFNYNKLNEISAPLYQQAFRWFREKYILSHICIMNELLYTGNYTHEEAELACLEKLIEIVEKS